MYNGGYTSEEDACCKLLGRDGEMYDGKHCLECVRVEDSNNVKQVDQPALLLQHCERTAPDWSLPPLAVEWLHGSDPCGKSSIEGDVGTCLFQRIASEIDGLKSAVYQIMCKGAQPNVAGYSSRVQQHQEEWQGSTPFTVTEEDCYPVVPGSSQATSSGIEDDLRESQSISSEMELFQSCDSDVGGGYSCGLSDTNPGGQERDEDWQVDQLAVRMLAAGILLDLQLRTQRV